LPFLQKCDAEEVMGGGELWLIFDHALENRNSDVGVSIDKLNSGPEKTTHQVVFILREDVFDFRLGFRSFPNIEIIGNEFVACDKRCRGDFGRPLIAGDSFFRLALPRVEVSQIQMRCFIFRFD